MGTRIQLVPTPVEPSKLRRPIHGLPSIRCDQNLQRLVRRRPKWVYYDRGKYARQTILQDFPSARVFNASTQSALAL